METSQHNCTSFVRSEKISSKLQTGVQWTTAQEHCMAECQTAWSMSPYFYSATNQPCLCSRYRPVSLYDKNTPWLQGNNSKSLEKPAELQQPDKASISKILKFGVERILSDECSLENNAVGDEKKDDKPSSSESISKGRRKHGTRSVFSHLQRNLLERHYQRREYVTKAERYHIALEVGITEEQVKIWFQNRRTKKKKLEINKISEKARDMWLNHSTSNY